MPNLAASLTVSLLALLSGYQHYCTISVPACGSVTRIFGIFYFIFTGSLLNRLKIFLLKIRFRGDIREINVSKVQNWQTLPGVRLCTG